MKSASTLYIEINLINIMLNTIKVASCMIHTLSDI